MRELTHELSNSTLNSLHEWWVEFDRKVGMHVLYGGLVTAKVCDSGVDVVHTCVVYKRKARQFHLEFL